jgi:hypothetical protein
LVNHIEYRYGDQEEVGYQPASDSNFPFDL